MVSSVVQDQGLHCFLMPICSKLRVITVNNLKQYNIRWFKLTVSVNPRFSLDLAEVIVFYFPEITEVKLK